MLLSLLLFIPFSYRVLVRFLVFASSVRLGLRAFVRPFVRLIGLNFVCLCFGSSPRFCFVRSLSTSCVCSSIRSFVWASLCLFLLGFVSSVLCRPFVEDFVCLFVHSFFCLGFTSSVCALVRFPVFASLVGSSYRLFFRQFVHPYQPSPSIQTLATLFFLYTFMLWLVGCCQIIIADLCGQVTAQKIFNLKSQQSNSCMNSLTHGFKISVELILCRYC